MKPFYRTFYSFLFLTLFLCSSLFPIRISPAVFTAKNLTVGGKFNLGIDLTVYSENDDTTYYVIRTLELSEYVGGVLEGYDVLPSLDWFSPKTGDTLRVSGKGFGSLPMIFSLPADNALLNQRYMVKLSVSPLGKSMFRTVAVTSYFLETKPSSPSDSNFVIPSGLLSVAPSSLILDNSGQGNFTVYNNQDTMVTIAIEAETPDTTGGVRMEPRSGFNWLDPMLFTISTDIDVSDNDGKKALNIPEKGSVLVTVKQKDTTLPGEITVFIRGENLPVRFVRVISEGKR